MINYIAIYDIIIVILQKQLDKDYNNVNKTYSVIKSQNINQ